MRYQELLDELKSLSDEKYRDFHKRLLKNDNIVNIGVKIPELRKIAKKYTSDIDELFTYPDDYYEVTFIKLTAASYLGYEDFLNYADTCVGLMDNWATCDCFSPKCIQKHRDEFLPYILKYHAQDKEFYQRFALTALLGYYVEEKYLTLIFELAETSNTEYYYVHMAVAWLIAELLVKYGGQAEEFLKKHSLDKKTQNKAIQKACESFRISDERKKYLKGLKR